MKTEHEKEFDVVMAWLLVAVIVFISIGMFVMLGNK